MIGRYKSTLGSAVLVAVVGMSITLDSQARKGPKRGQDTGDQQSPIERLDTNEDLVVDFDEFTARSRNGARLIERLDSNDDGALDYDEFASRSGPRSELAGEYAEELIACVEEMSGTEVESRPTPEQAFDTIDSNDDDVISADELESAGQAKAEAKFDAIDQNGDDLLNEEEFAAAGEAKNARRSDFMACRDAIMIMDEVI